MKCDHTKQMQSVRRPCKWQLTAAGKFCDIHTIGRETADSQIRVGAGKIVDTLAWITQRTTVVAGAKSGIAVVTDFFHQTEGSCVVCSLCVQDCFFIFIAVDLPKRLNDHNLVFCKDICMQFFYGSAIRRTGIIGIVTSAAIFFAI